MRMRSTSLRLASWVRLRRCPLSDGSERGMGVVYSPEHEHKPDSPLHKPERELDEQVLQDGTYLDVTFVDPGELFNPRSVDDLEL